jgi:hypothetical protein
MYQRVTLSDPRVAQLINENFVATYFDYAQPALDSRPEGNILNGHITGRQPTYDGHGAGQVCIFLCNSQGRIVHRLDGFTLPETLIAEAEWALELINGARANSADARDLLMGRLQSLRQLGENSNGQDYSRISRATLEYQIRMLVELSQSYFLQRPELFLLRVFVGERSDDAA